MKNIGDLTVNIQVDQEQIAEFKKLSRKVQKKLKTMRKELSVEIRDKLLARHFTDETALVVGKKEFQCQVIAEHLTGLNVEVNGCYWRKPIRFHFDEDDSQAQQDELPIDICRIELTRNGFHASYTVSRQPIEAHMTISADRHSQPVARPVSNLDQLKTLVAVTEERLDREAAKLRRQQNHDSLRHQCIKAQIAQYAKKYDFEFEVVSPGRTAKGKIKVDISTSTKRVVELNIPLTQFDQLPDNFGQTIEAMIVLCEQNIRFKVTN